MKSVLIAKLPLRGLSRVRELPSGSTGSLLECRASTARSLLPSYDAALEWLEQEPPSVLEVIGRLAAGAGADRTGR
jgi:hypothetical protein